MKLSKERLEEIELAITLWKESGLNQGEFCRQENIHRTTFQSWRKKYDPSYGNGISQKTSPKTRDKFLAVQIQDNKKDTDEDIIFSGLEICYPNHVKVKCLSNLNPKDLRSLIN